MCKPFRERLSKADVLTGSGAGIYIENAAKFKALWLKMKVNHGDDGIWINSTGLHAELHDISQHVKQGYFIVEGGHQLLLSTTLPVLMILKS